MVRSGQDRALLVSRRLRVEVVAGQPPAASTFPQADRPRSFSASKTSSNRSGGFVQSRAEDFDLPCGPPLFQGRAEALAPHRVHRPDRRDADGRLPLPTRTLLLLRFPAAALVLSYVRRPGCLGTYRTRFCRSRKSISYVLPWMVSRVLAACASWTPRFRHSGRRPVRRGAGVARAPGGRTSLGDLKGAVVRGDCGDHVLNVGDHMAACQVDPVPLGVALAGRPEQAEEEVPLRPPAVLEVVGPQEHTAAPLLLPPVRGAGAS